MNAVEKATHREGGRKVMDLPSGQIARLPDCRIFSLAVFLDYYLKGGDGEQKEIASVQKLRISNHIINNH
jgi:hypothetical protein